MPIDVDACSRFRRQRWSSRGRAPLIFSRGHVRDHGTPYRTSSSRRSVLRWGFFSRSFWHWQHIIHMSRHADFVTFSWSAVWRWWGWWYLLWEKKTCFITVLCWQDDFNLLFITCKTVFYIHFKLSVCVCMILRIECANGRVWLWDGVPMKSYRPLMLAKLWSTLCTLYFAYMASIVHISVARVMWQFILLVFHVVSA